MININKKIFWTGIINLVLILTIVFTYYNTSNTNAAENAESKQNFSEYVASDGAITLPSNYRKDWSHLGSWVVPNEEAPGYGFHDVYTQRNTVDKYNKTGKFPDGAVLVKEIRKVTTGPLTTGKEVHWAGDNAVWFVMIKDTKNRFPKNPNWGDGWGWALYEADDPSKNVSTDYKKDCIGCHTPAKKTDWVFIQGYPTLGKN